MGLRETSPSLARRASRIDGIRIRQDTGLAFPTRVGMNRKRVRRRTGERPHARGDEPSAEVVDESSGSAFPTRVGMNRAAWANRGRADRRSPRAWG